jgi:SAM-dependent methyltransferase
MGGDEIRDATDNKLIVERHPSTHVFTSIEDICEFDRMVWEATRELPIRTGSILRVPSEAYGRWRVGLTDKNREELAEMADEFRRKDYRERERDPRIENVQKTSESLSMRDSMARVIGHLVKEVMGALNKPKREFTICDLAAGRGYASSAIAAALWADSGTSSLLEKTSFYLVDYSGKKLENVRRQLETYSPKRINLHISNDDDFLNSTRERFDIVVSLCHFHKKPFLLDTLNGINGILMDKGVLVSGDWHSMLCDQPYYVYNLLERLGVESARLKHFRDLFGRFLDPGSYPELLPEEIMAVTDHQDHWVDVHYDILQSKTTLAEGARMYILGGFDTTRKRVEKLEEAKLITDPEKIRKAFPKANLTDNPMRMVKASDRASVIMAMKKRSK